MSSKNEQLTEGVPVNLFIKGIPYPLMKQLLQLKEKYKAKTWKEFLWIITKNLENNKTEAKT